MATKEQLKKAGAKTKLKKGDSRTKEIASKGGKARAEALQGEALIRKLLALKPKNEDEVAMVLATFDLKTEDVSEETLLHIAAINKAKDGDMAAYEKVLKAAGYLKDKVENTIRTGEENGIRIIETHIGK